jgi:hypothetical protein
MEERSGGGRKERSELEQIPAIASRGVVVMDERGSARGRLRFILLPHTSTPASTTSETPRSTTAMATTEATRIRDEAIRQAQRQKELLATTTRRGYTAAGPPLPSRCGEHAGGGREGPAGAGSGRALGVFVGVDNSR